MSSLSVTSGLINYIQITLTSSKWKNEKIAGLFAGIYILGKCSGPYIYEILFFNDKEDLH